MDTATTIAKVAEAKAELTAALAAIKDAETVVAREAALVACHRWVESYGAFLINDAEVLNAVVTEANVKGYTLDALHKQL